MLCHAVALIWLLSLMLPFYGEPLLFFPAAYSLFSALKAIFLACCVHLRFHDLKEHPAMPAVPALCWAIAGKPSDRYNVAVCC